MVFFTCDHCGNALKKNQVEGHFYKQCRGKPIVVSCMDCTKEFREQEYVKHTKCISEDEKYSAKGTYEQKPSSNRNEQKQGSWVAFVCSMPNIRTDLSQNDISAFEVLKNYENIPRKLKKFKNFMINVMGPKFDRDGHVDRFWAMIMEEWEKISPKKPVEAENNESINGMDVSTDKIEENGTENTPVENTSVAPEETKLSKKERKKLLKKEKYEAQLKEIENEPTEPPPEVEEEEVTTKKIKNRKRNMYNPRVRKLKMGMLRLRRIRNENSRRMVKMFLQQVIRCRRNRSI